MKRFTQFYAFLLISLLVPIVAGGTATPTRVESLASKGAITAAGSITSTAAVTGATVSATGLVSGGSISTAGAMSSATDTVSGLLTAGSITSTGKISTTGSLGAGTATPDSKAILDLVSTTKVMLPPRMTTAERDAIGSPPTGSVIFNTTTATLNQYNGSAWGAVSGGGGGFFDKTQNLLTNSSFENDVAGWSASGGTLARETGSANVEPPGVGALSWDSTAAGQTLSSNTTTITSGDGLSGRSGVFSAAWKADSGTPTHMMEVIDGSGNTLTSATILSSTSGYIRNSLNFIMPASGSVYGRAKSVAANEPKVYSENMYLGLAEGYNISSVSQASIYGTAVHASTSNCTWSVVGTTIATPAADADCPAPTVTGYASAPGTKIPGIRFAGGLPPGKYKITATGQFVAVRTATSADLYLRFTDGTTNSAKAYNLSFGSTSSVSQQYAQSTFVGVFTYTTAQGDTTFALQTGGSGTGKIDADGSDLQFIVERFPLDSEQTYRPDTIAWRVDANISGAHADLGTASVTDYASGVVENAGLTLTNNTGAGVLTAQIPCSSTNAASGTTCSAGSESVGVAFTLPKSGDVRACSSFSHFVATGASGAVSTTFQLVETADGSQTTVQEGKDRIESGTGTASGSWFFPQKVCGTFSFSSSGKKVLRLRYEQATTATVTSNLVLADAGATHGQRDIHWEVYPINQQVPAPLLVGSVTASSTNIQSGGASGLTTIDYGTYTPTGTAVTNVASITPATASYMRVGNKVFVWGSASVDPTAGSGLFRFRLTVPIASNFAAVGDLIGTFGNDGSGSDLGFGVTKLIADTTNDAADVTGILTTALHGATTIYYHYSYTVL